MALLDRHLDFLEALRAAGIPVSLAEGLDAVAALGQLDWDEREAVRIGYAATVVKRQSQRPTFDALFELYFPSRIGHGVALAEELDAEEPEARASEQARADLQNRLLAALLDDDPAALAELAAEAVARFGVVPNPRPGLSAWSAYNALRGLSPHELIPLLAQQFQAEGLTEGEARRAAGRRLVNFNTLVESDARRRIAEAKGPARLAEVSVRPTLERLDFLAARRDDVAALRREITPLARRLAARLTKEQRSQRRGPLDFRRTIRASMSTGGVPVTTYHRPKRPHRTNLVVLCDVSSSVSSFAQFTLLLVHAMREQFTGVRAFLFVDKLTEVTKLLVPGSDPAEVMANLVAASEDAVDWGRTDYGQAFRLFAAQHGDALGPKASLLVLGDARSNYSGLALPTFKGLADSARNAWWLNPEPRQQWDTGDSAAAHYGAVAPMVECRNLTQLGQFVHDIL